MIWDGIVGSKSVSLNGLLSQGTQDSLSSFKTHFYVLPAPCSLSVDGHEALKLQGMSAGSQVRWIPLISNEGQSGILLADPQTEMPFTIFLWLLELLGFPALAWKWLRRNAVNTVVWRIIFGIGC